MFPLPRTVFSRFQWVKSCFCPRPCCLLESVALQRLEGYITTVPIPPGLVPASPITYSEEKIVSQFLLNTPLLMHPVATMLSVPPTRPQEFMLTRLPTLTLNPFQSLCHPGNSPLFCRHGLHSFCFWFPSLDSPLSFQGQRESYLPIWTLSAWFPCLQEIPDKCSHLVGGLQPALSNQRDAFHMAADFETALVFAMSFFHLLASFL